MTAPEVERRMAARAAAPFIGYARVVTVQTDLHLVAGHIAGTLRVEMLPQLLNIQVDHREHAQYRQGNVSCQPVTDLQRRIVLHFNRRHGDADQIDIEHDPLFQLLQHQQHRSQVHTKLMTNAEITDASHQRHRCADGAERHH